MFPEILAAVTIIILLLGSIIIRIASCIRPLRVSVAGGATPSREPLLLAVSIPKGYVSFLDQVLPATARPRGQLGYNMGAVPLPTGKHKYLFTVRFSNNIKGLMGEPIVPGSTPSASTSSEWRDSQVKLHYGQNSPWSIWPDCGYSTTVFFEATFEDGELHCEENTWHGVVTNHPAMKYRNAYCMEYVTDFRLAPYGDAVCAYDGSTTCLFKLSPPAPFPTLPNKYLSPKTWITGPDLYYFMCDSKTQKRFDKNWALLPVKTTPAVELQFLDKFGPKGLEVTTVRQGPRGSTAARCTTKTAIRYGRDAIPFLRTDRLPVFSLGGPAIALPDGSLLAVGHTKIPSTDQLAAGSYLEKFRATVHRTLEEGPGTYVAHWRDIYLLYFIHLDPSIGSGRISNSYLPRFVDPAAAGLDYTFSLVFPMAAYLGSDPTHLEVFGGYGDHTCLIMRFDLDSVLAACCHAIADFNGGEYRCSVLDIAADLTKTAAWKP